MKQFLLPAAVLLGGSLLAQQQLTPAEYDQLKSSGQLNPQANYIVVTPDQHVQTSSAARYSGPAQAQSSACSCLIPLDTTFAVVPFNGYTAPDYRNDDASSMSIPLPFSFNFYGTNYDSIFINNNGNISFNQPYMTFTANAFPDSTYAMIAPFWADVDTRNAPSGLVYYKMTATHLIVKWESVGYYSMHTDKMNTFQLIITDGLDSILPAGTNVAFCYGDMQWTTGDASSGSNGFGGVASTTGVNQGNGTDYFQVTQNDAAGSAFDGPYGLADGIDFLDDQEIYFNTSILGNTPPLVLNSTICDTIDVYTGDTLRSMNIDSIAFEFKFFTPESDQTVTASLTTSAPASAFSYTISDNTATYKSYNCVFRAKDLPPSVYTVTGTGTDDGSPAATTSSTVYIHTHFDASLGVPNTTLPMPITTPAYPNPATGIVTVNTLNASGFFLTNTLGQVVYSAAANGNLTSLDMSGFAPGVYMLNVQNNDGTVSKSKLIRR